MLNISMIKYILLIWSIKLFKRKKHREYIFGKIQAST